MRSRHARRTQSWGRSLEGEAGGCPHRVDVAAYTLGALDRRQEAEVTAHLATCRQCRVALDSVAAIPGLLAWTHPAGGTPAKPVGTVCIAWGLSQGEHIAETRLFAGDREAVRRQSVESALTGVLALLSGDSLIK